MLKINKEPENQDKPVATLHDATSKYAIQIYRNRSELEADVVDTATGEISERVPVRWKERKGKLDYLSVSKIQAYEQCPACFYYQYLSEETKHIDGANYFTKFGTALHEVCENVMKAVMQTGLAVPFENFLKEAWKNAGFSGESTFADYNQAKGLLDAYFKKNPPTGRSDFPVLLEEEWRGELGGVTFGLMMDYVGQFDNNPNWYILRDYKTNRMPYTTADLQDSLQLRIYKLVLKRHYYPDAEKIIAGYDLFFHGWQQCPDWTNDELLTAEEYVATIANQINSDNNFDPHINNYCCYRECRHTCPAYQDMMKNTKSFFVQFDETNLEEVEKQRVLMTTIEKNAKQRKEECNKILKTEIEQRAMNNDTLVLDGKQLSLYSSSKSSYRYHDVHNVLLSKGKESLLDDCLTIQKTKLDKKLDSQTKLELAGCLDTGYASPYIVTKKA